MRQIIPQITKYNCGIHGESYLFICTEVVCQHKWRMMCDKCVNLSKGQSISIRATFQFLEDQIKKEKRDIYECRAKFIQQFNIMKVQILKSINQMEHRMYRLLDSIKPNETIRKIKKEYLNREVKANDLEVMAQYLSHSIELDKDGNYHFKQRSQLSHTKEYIEATRIIQSLEQSLNELNNTQLPIQDNITTDYTTTQVAKLDGYCYYVSLNHKETQLAVAVDKSIQLFSLSEDGIWIKELQQLNGHNDTIWQVKFNYDSSQLVSCSDDKQIIIWSQRSKGIWQIQNSINSHSQPIYSVCYNYDYTQLASGSADATVQLFSVYQQSKKQSKFITNSGIIYDVCFNNDSTILAAATLDMKIILWQQRMSGQWDKQELTGHKSYVTRVSFNKDSTQLVSSSDDNSIKIWSADKQKVWQCNHTLIGHGQPVTCALFNNQSNMIVSSSKDNTVKIWRTNTSENWECTQTLFQHKEWVNHVIISRDARFIISASCDSTIRIHRLPKINQE